MNIRSTPARLALAQLILCAAAFAQTTATNPPKPPPVAPNGARAVEDVSSPVGWKRYEIQFGTGNVVSVVLPAPPKVETNQIPMGTAKPATMHMLTSESKSSVFVVGYMEGLPAEVTDNKEVQPYLFEKLWSGVAEGLATSLRENKVTAEVVAQPRREETVSGQRAQAQDFTVGDLAAGRARAVIAGGHLYMVFGASVSKSLSAEAAAFAASFELRAAR